MKLSNSSEYSLLAMLALVDCYHNGDLMQIKEIAELQGIPNRYLEQLLAILRCRGLINSIRGSKGGYVLAHDPRKITVLDVLTSIEGVEIDASTNNTTLENIESSVVEEIWQEACQAANLVLQKYSLQDLWEKQTTHPQKALMYYILKGVFVPMFNKNIFSEPIGETTDVEVWLLGEGLKFSDLGNDALSISIRKQWREYQAAVQRCCAVLHLPPERVQLGGVYAFLRIPNLQAKFTQNNII